MKKRLFAILITLVLVCPQNVFSVANTAEEPTLNTDGMPISMLASVKEGALFLPLRAVSEALGYKVGWSQAERTIDIQKQEKSLLLSLKDAKIQSNGHEYFMRDIPFILEGRTYMPSEFFSEEYGLEVKWDKEENRVSLSSIQHNSLNISTGTLASPNPKQLDATIQYPVVSGVEDPSIEDQINSTFKAIAEQSLKEGEKNVADLAPYLEQNPDIPWKCEVYFDYQIKYSRSSLLSVVFQNYQYAGGAHGSTVQTSYTFDLITGKQLQLGDLFKANAGYIDIISDQVYSQLKERGLLAALYGKFESIRPDHSFYLTDGGVAVYYQQYEIMPYAAGIQEFTTNYDQLNEQLVSPELYKPIYIMPGDPGRIWPSVQTGTFFSLSLNGNPTTGYTWHYIIENPDIASVVSEKIVPDSDLLGAGSTFSWTLKALKPGNTRIIFKYYRDWEGEVSTTAENALIYNLTIE